MDFSALQEKARTNSSLLVIYFIIAIVCIIAAVYGIGVLLAYYAQAPSPSDEPPPALALWNPTVFLYAAVGTVVVVLGGWLYKAAALSAGGSAVAESLGGRLLDDSPTSPHERQLRNVVEEMSIASGVPMPRIYVLDDEGINAFAAGHSPSDAAIAVTHGCLTTLSRDELQGVLGHEFSHLLNGDMRLNLRLMGIIFGILSLTVIGRILLFSRSGDSRGRNPMVLFGIALVVIGAIGALFARVIQAALSRQRESLADASSVQFTRNPAGLSSALQKIGAIGSRIDSPHASEASHMFFANGISAPLLGMLATHPPLADRIRAIDPGWDGQFKQLGTATAEAESENPIQSGTP
jgi:Zn-dependent protease with chaperone function